MTGWRGGVEAGIKEHRANIGIGRTFCSLLKGHVPHHAEVLASTPNWQELYAAPRPHELKN
jgi:hypothetical protein